jgi:hypothetical protein
MFTIYSSKVENEFLAYRLMNLQPQVYRKGKLDRNYSEQKGLKNLVKRFHILKPKSAYSKSK